jgi:hypothetical protein
MCPHTTTYLSSYYDYTHTHTHMSVHICVRLCAAQVRGGRAAAARQCLYVGGAAEADALTEQARLGGGQGGGGKENRGTRSREGRGCETRKLFCGKGSQDRSGSFTCTTSGARAPPRSSSCTVIASFLPISHLLITYSTGSSTQYSLKWRLWQRKMEREAEI